MEFAYVVSESRAAKAAGEIVDPNPIAVYGDSWLAFRGAVNFARQRTAKDGWFYANADAEEVRIYDGKEPKWMPDLGTDVFHDHRDGLSDDEIDALEERLERLKPRAVITVLGADVCF